MAEVSVVNQDEFSGKYLTFWLKEELYGISVGSILQIIAIPQITPIPKTPEFVRGVINLRGKIIPVIDLRLKFNLEKQEYDARTSIIVIKSVVNQAEVYIGIIVDTVLEVIDIATGQIEDRPSFGVDMDMDYIKAMAKVDEKVITLLNIDNIVTKNDLILVNKAENQATG